jgi:hypothetical protein
MRGCPFPNQLVAKVLVPENTIHHYLDVMAGGRIAVKIDRAGGPQDAFHMQQPVHHVDQIGQKVRLRVP